MNLIDDKESLKAISVEELEQQAHERDLLTPREVAKLLGVHPQQVYQWIRKRIIRYEKCECGRTMVRVSRSKAQLNKKARDLGKPEPYPLDEFEELMLKPKEERIKTVKLQELLDAVKGWDPEMEVQIELIGDEFQDGDLLKIDEEVPLQVKFGKITLPVLSNEESE